MIFTASSMVSALAVASSSSGAEDLAPMFVFFIVMAGCFVIILGAALALQVFACWYLVGCVQALPPQYRKIEPGTVWLLMIPLFGVVWNFFVYPQIAESYRNYFAAQGRNDLGDCGGSLATTYCVLCCITMIPYVGSAVGIAVLVLWIMLLVKFGELKKLVAAPATPFPVMQGPR